MTPAQKRNKADFEKANEIMAAASELMRRIDEAKEMGLYVSAACAGWPTPSFIKVIVRRDMASKSIPICNAEIGK